MVNEPKNPTMRKIFKFSESISLFSNKLAIRPIKKQPIIFTIKIPYGKLEINNFNQIIIFASGGLLLVGRFMHAKSFLKDEMDVTLRINGMKCTFWSLRILAGLNIFAIVMTLI